MEKQLAAPPKPEKAVEYLSPAEQASAEANLPEGVKLPRDEQGRTRKDFFSPVSSYAGAKEGRVQSANQFGTTLNLKKQEIAKADAEKAADVEIPGYSRDSKIGVKPDEAQKLRDAAGEASSIKRDVAKLESLISQHGLEFDPRSPVKAEMEGYLKDLQLKMKGRAVYELGVLSGPDMQILESVTGDPTVANLKNILGGPDVALSRLRGVRERTAAGLAEKMAARGYGATRVVDGKTYRQRSDGKWEEL
jgi:hypothetical protein